MCPVCHTYYVNHVKHPIDSEFSFVLQTHKQTDPFPTIHYKKSPVRKIKPPLTNARSPSPPPPRKRVQPTSNDTRCSSRVAKGREMVVKLRRETVSTSSFQLFRITKLFLYLE